MLRIISLFLLLIISRVSFSETILAIATTQSSSDACIAAFKANAKNIQYGRQFVLINYDLGTGMCNVSYSYGGTDTYPQDVLYSISTTYSCLSGYAQTDSAGNPDSSGQYCTKSACADYSGTSIELWFPVNSVPNTGCYAGCKATATIAINYGSATEMPYVYQTFTMADEVCTGSMSYADAATAQAANAAAQAAADAAADPESDDTSDWGDAADAPDAPDIPPCSTEYNTGSVNGETIAVPATGCTDAGAPIADTPSSSTSTDTSGQGSTVGSPENTSGTQNSTVGGGADSLGGEGYGEGGSTGSSGGADSGSTSSGGSDSGSTSGSGTDSGGTSSGGSDSGSTSGSGTDSGGTSSGGADSGSTSGGGTDSGGSSGSGGGSDTGTGAPTSGAGDTDSDTPAEEEEESGDGGGTFAAPGAGTDYLKDVFGESDLASLATDNAELTTKINQKMADVKGIFNLGTLSVSGDIPENQQEIKGASVDLSGRNIFEQLSIVAAAFYLCAIATAIYIVMGGKK